ncbi:uncharacterized protein [Blastocystis hominis]|uniref:C3H1-type domain-containing protein n=1 Tax=Blastocystis hominis TaxID=12968 RepID=D8M422_BLAHO|nr:uncharacterized protein [Blastocystis hominis]CBK22811.2 unnamed protein product [Blastocystis hominis]|eukprot:XP_012896859.1 uncharacterized protein [Blastocystis hominis]
MSTDRGMPVKRDANIQDVENDEFPILCETCLGNNPYVRMIRVPYGKGCKSCGRPFTNFRWKAGTDARYKSTQVCQMCAKTKNVCQCCVLDLTFGLPTQVRDTFLARQQVLTMPIEKANRAVYMQEMEKKVLPPYRTLFTEVNATLLRLARKKPFYQRNLPQLCSFYARGCCTRGKSCPYRYSSHGGILCRHELPHDPNDPLNKQNVKDRFDGKNDPVAQKILERIKQQEKDEERERKEVISRYLIKG